MKKLPNKYSGIVMPFILSCFMTFIVSLISLIRAKGFSLSIINLWPSAWIISWAIAFPILLLILPFVRKIVNFIVE